MLRSPRETTQPNRQDVEYWATGLTPVYLEGALRRALNPLQVRHPPPKPEPVAKSRRPTSSSAGAASAREHPESVLRVSERRRGAPQQLSALSAWHLANIAKAYDLVPEDDADRLSHPALVELILSAVKRRSEAIP